MTNMFNLLIMQLILMKICWDVHNVTTMGQMFFRCWISIKILVDGIFKSNRYECMFRSPHLITYWKMECV